MKKYVLTLTVIIGFLLAGCGEKEPSGTELLKEERYEEAIDKFQEAIDEKLNPEEAYRGQGIAYWELEDYQRSRAAFTKALAYDAKETGTICNFIGLCDLKLGSPQSAAEWFEKGIAKEDSSPELIREMEYNQIIAYEQVKNWDKAKEKLTAYIEKYPDDAEALKESQFLETRQGKE